MLNALRGADAGFMSGAAASYFDLKKSAWQRCVVDLVREDGLDPLG